MQEVFGISSLGLDVNDVTETTGIVPNGIVVDDAVTDATVADGTVANDTATDDSPANGKISAKEKMRMRMLKKGKKSRV